MKNIGNYNKFTDNNKERYCVTENSREEKTRDNTNLFRACAVMQIYLCNACSQPKSQMIKRSINSNPFLSGFNEVQCLRE